MTTKTVELGGESRPIKFGFNALIEFSEMTGRTIEQLNTINTSSISMKDLLLLCWCALKQGARREKIPFDVTVEDVGDWLDDNPEAMVVMVSEYLKSKSGDPTRVENKKKQGARKNH